MTRVLERPRRALESETGTQGRRSGEEPYRQKNCSRKPLVLNTPQGKKVVGHLVTEHGHTWLEKRVDPAKHLHRRFDAWGIDAGLVDSLEQEGVSRIRCLLTTGEIEEAPLRAFGEHGIRFDFGHGPQVFLPRRFWSVEDRKQARLF